MFISVDNVQGIVEITRNPNKSQNPQPLNSAHTRELASIFFQRGGKQDQESPIYLVIDPELVDLDLRKKMAMVNPKDINANEPHFELIRLHAEEERDLEFAITF